MREISEQHKERFETDVKSLVDKWADKVTPDQMVATIRWYCETLETTESLRQALKKTA
jgi:hypothetical protein